MKFLSDERLKVAFVILRVKKDMKLQKLAQKFAIPHFVCEDINNEKSLRLIESFKPNLLVSMSFDQIFKARILKSYEGRIINCHASKLPFYRGRNNLNWVLINDEKEFGVSVHFIDSGVDTGDIILQKSFSISDEDDYSTLLKRAYKACAFLLYEAVLLFLNPPVKSYSQAGFVCKRRGSGDELIDWSLNTRELFNFIRALNAPNLGASAFINGVLIKLYKSEILKQEFKGAVGEIVSVSNEGFVVCTKDGALKMTHYEGEVALGSFFDTHTGGGGVTLSSKKELWKMSKVSLDAFLGDKSGNFSEDLYFSKEYAKLYGEVFEFSFEKNGAFFKTIALKKQIPNSPFFDLQSPYGYSGFYANTNDESFLKQALESLRKRALNENIIAFFLRLHPFDINLGFYEKHLDFFKKERQIVLINCTQDFASLRKAYSPRILSYVKKARKELTISFCDSTYAEAFCKLYEKTMLRNRADSFYFFDQKYFDTLFALKQNVVLRAEFEGKILAFASFFVGKEFAYYHLSANCNEKNANAALLDFFFEFCTQKGVKFVILGGGVRDNDALYYFKSRFSTLYGSFYIAGLIFDAKNYATLCEGQNNAFFLKYRSCGGGGGLSFF
ncbi:formyltransferase family protein [Campylobacter upsaliensis]|uniref:formyltransferase family protein n=2 Tax=Campylobacter TaxID=194 RepID=UPI00214A46EB|nr:formyltransferase family protein [Campylobacter upsaliensis]MCR2111210.1 hypothetical protein [Campylobacter upsaliensis]